MSSTYPGPLLSKQVQFGLALIPSQHPDIIGRLGQLADNYFDYMWIRDENPSYPFRDVFTTLTLLAMKTDSVKLGTGICTPYTRHPALIAETITSLHELSKGRMTLGLAAGGSLTLPRLKVPMWNRPVEVLREAVEIIRRLFKGEHLNYKGWHFTVENVKVAQNQYAEIPIHIGARGPKLIQLAGEIADGLQIHQSRGYLAYALEQLAIGAQRRKSGMLPIEVVASSLYYYDEDIVKARKAVKYNMTWSIPDSPKIILEKMGVSREDANKISEVRDTKGREAAMELIPDSLADSAAIIGNVDACIDKILSKIKEGATHVVLSGQLGEDKVKAVEIAGKEIIPKVKQRIGLL
jgi:5,10-methylenetetrahydromethanopterin reductase